MILMRLCWPWLGLSMKIKAHVPTQQYGFIEISGTPEEESLILEAYNRYAESPISWKASTTKRIKAFVGGEIDYDEVNHIYSWNGVKYMSGSEYASKNKKPFDADKIAGAMAKKFGVKPSDITDVWKMNSELSRDFGTVLHKALEMYGKYRGLAEGMEKEYHISSHPLLKTAVESFYKGRDAEVAEYECLIVDHEAKRAGCIDRLLVGASNICTIQDFKITTKEDPEYWADQLGFYAGIMEAGGWKVIGKEIHQYSGAWRKIEV